MFKQGIRLSLAALLAGTTINGISVNGTAQSPYPGRTTSPGIGIQQPGIGQGQLRPVPRHGAVSEAAPPAHDPQHPGWDLRWRRSPQAQPSQVDSPRLDPAPTTSPAVTAQTVHRVPQTAPTIPSTAPVAAATRGGGQLQLASESPELRQVDGAAVKPVAWLGDPRRSDPRRSDPQRSDPFAAPSGLRVSQAQSGGVPQRSTPDFFDAPFGDKQPAPASPKSSGGDDAFVLPPPADQEFVPPAADQLNETDNQLRGPIEFEQRSPTPEATQPEESLFLPPPSPVQDRAATPPRAAAGATPAAPEADSGPSLREMLRKSPPSVESGNGAQKNQNGSVEELPAPAAQPPFINPFDEREKAEADRMDRNRLNQQRMIEDEYRPDGSRYGGGTDFLDPKAFSCEDFRQRIASQTIDKVSLDVSPPFRPDEFDMQRYEELKSDFNERQVIRDWITIDGKELAKGRLLDLAYEKAVVEREDGSIAKLPINRLSEGDIAYITENWGLPRECLIEQVAYAPRDWTATTMTWKASNLCHNPLYFEDVNLERYGHTHGPVLEPFVQSAHFFGNIAVLPYKMGVHAPHECQYALGYYRPGDCAPWIKPPVPLSARGAIAQAATMTGLFWLIP